MGDVFPYLVYFLRPRQGYLTLSFVNGLRFYGFIEFS